MAKISDPWSKRQQRHLSYISEYTTDIRHVQGKDNQVQSHIRAPLEKFVVPHRRFDHIHIDLVGPLPPSQGCTHLLTVVDRFTRWPEAIPLSATDALTCANALVAHWIARFGVPMDATVYIPAVGFHLSVTGN